jgi:hypothetical protein
MTLDTFIDKLKAINRKLFDKFGQLYYASLAYLSIKGLDITSTSLYLHEQNNLNAEANDLARHLMEQFGINAGLIIKNSNRKIPPTCLWRSKIGSSMSPVPERYVGETSQR